MRGPWRAAIGGNQEGRRIGEAGASTDWRRARAAALNGLGEGEGGARLTNQCGARVPKQLPQHPKAVLWRARELVLGRQPVLLVRESHQKRDTARCLCVCVCFV